MILKIKLNRSEGLPWGFRVTGGLDSDQPLTIVKVCENSSAEKSGLKIGDVIMKINNVGDLNHSIMNELISNSTDCLTLEVNRDAEVYSDIEDNIDPTDEVSEACIAEIISAEAELLEGHNVIGVNFQKIMPKANIFKSSEVLKHLNEETFRRRLEKEESTFCSTFLQKPNRPPKTKESQNAISPKEETEIFFPILECVSNTFCVEQFNEHEIENVDESQSLELQNESDDDDGDIPDLIVIQQKDSNQEVSIQNEEDTKSIDENVENNECCENNENDIEKQQLNQNINQEKIDIIKKQLEVLGQMPSTLESTLEIVSKHISEVFLKLNGLLENPIEDIQPSLIEQQNSNIDIEMIESDTKTVTIETNEVHVELNEEHSTEVEVIPSEKAESANNKQEPIEENTKTNDEAVERVVEKLEEEHTAHTEIRQPRNGKHPEIKKAPIKKISRIEEKIQNIEEELKQKLIVINPEKRSGLKTPQSQRPVVLPGGRKWRNEKDAYNDDFIAEVMSSQAELITGSTIGKYESPLLGYDNRINFLKYKKPEKDLSNLQRSEVLKLIHSGSSPAYGISDRPPKVLAAVDFMINNVS